MHINPTVTIDVATRPQKPTVRGGRNRAAPTLGRPRGRRPLGWNVWELVVVEHRRRVVLIWVVAALLAGIFGASQLGRLSTDFGAGEGDRVGRVSAALDAMAGTRRGGDHRRRNRHHGSRRARNSAVASPGSASSTASSRSPRPWTISGPVADGALHSQRRTAALLVVTPCG